MKARLRQDAIVRSLRRNGTSTLADLAEAVGASNPRPPTSIEDVKAECRRRILAIMTEDQQRNTLAAGQAAMMEYGTDPAGWPPELQVRQSVAMVAWAEIERLRAISDEIEDMDPQPADVGDEGLWASSLSSD